MDRLEAREATLQFVDCYFPACLGALLAGSVVRGQRTTRSDLDIVIFDSTLPSAYRESLYFKNWSIEVFVHNLESDKRFIALNCHRASPSLARMVFGRNYFKG